MIRRSSYSLIAGGRIIRRRFESIENKSVATKRTLPVFKPPSGTLANKLDFCYAAIKEIDGLDGFADYSRDLALRIHEFIEAHNQK